jgi:hypothetical protein
VQYRTWGSPTRLGCPKSPVSGGVRSYLPHTVTPDGSKFVFGKVKQGVPYQHEWGTPLGHHPVMPPDGPLSRQQLL